MVPKWDKSAPDISSVDLAGFGSNPSTQAVSVVHNVPKFDAALCDAEKIYDATGNPAADPCPERQFYNARVAPAVGPQPENWGCPNRGLTPSSTTIWLSDPQGINLSSPVISVTSGGTVSNIGLGSSLSGSSFSFSVPALSGMSVDSAKLVGVQSGGMSRSSPLFIGR